MKLYIFILSSSYDRKAVIDHLTERGMIGQWFYSMPNSFFAPSNKSADELSEAVRIKFGENRHFITRVSDDRQGWMPQDHWSLLYKNE